jgi:1-acyl-sn-glycerol-3-phosphate acyltransferase
MCLHILQGLFCVGVIYPRVSPRTRQKLTGAWSAKMLRILNIVLSVHGARPAADARHLVVVANHVSWLDIFAINAAQPSRFVAKSEIRDWPVAGWLCEKAGTIFVRRAKRSDTSRINREIHDALEQGDAVALFPEGTTTTGDRLLKFHTALFEPAVVNGATIAAGAIRYRASDGTPAQSAIFAGETSFAESITLIIAQKSMIAELVFAPAIETRLVDQNGAIVSASRRDVAIAAEEAIARILNVPKPHAHQRFAEGATMLASVPEPS